MAIAAPEIAAAGAEGGGLGAALGFGAGRGSDSLGGFNEAGSPAAFMLAIVLVGGALMAFWLAFHNPAEWDLTGGQWPGLLGRVLSWMTSKAEGPSLLGALNTSQPAAVSPDQAAINAITRLEGNPILGSPLPPTEQKTWEQRITSALKQLIGGGIL